MNERRVNDVVLLKVHWTHFSALRVAYLPTNKMESFRATDTHLINLALEQGQCTFKS